MAISARVPVRKSAVLALVIAGTMVIAGCATHAPPTLEEIRTQSGTLADMPLLNPWKAGANAGPITDNWLASFQDEQLNALVAEAMAKNTDLRISAARVEQAAQYIEIAKAKLRPAVSFFGTGGANMGGGDALQLASLGASWEMDLWGRLRYSRNAYAATHASTVADFEFSRQSLAATVAKSWITATETLLQLQLSEEMIASSKELVTLAETRLKVGRGSEQDLALARTSLGAFQDNVLQLRLAHEQTVRAMELLLGRYPGAELQTRRDLPALPGPIPAGLPLEMLERRPDIIAAERRVAAAFNRVGEAKAAQLPTLSLNANIAAIKSDILALNEDYENPSGGIGARFLAPLYSGGALVGQVSLRTAEQKEAVAQYAGMALRAVSDVENALSASRTLAERDQLLGRIVAENQRVLELVQTSYRIGTADLRAVQQQLLTLQSTKLTLLRVQSEQLAQRINLHLALGGSFETARLEPFQKEQPPEEKEEEKNKAK
jgi:NodT family efflux transporter outer membrane factor (OMF) lipoprotein